MIAAAVLGVEDVAAMSAGPLGQYRSYLPGGSVPGVRIEDDHLDINVVSRYGLPLPEVGEHIVAALRSLLLGRSVTVSIDDLVLPDESTARDAGRIVQPRDAS